jgi:hypothetical protein
LTVTTGTKPNILVDFNDGSTVIFQSNGILNNVYTFDHTFPGGGYYDVNITVFNLVSTISRTIRVSQISISLKHNLYLN